MKKYIPVLLIMIALPSCQFSKSVNKNLISGLITKGDGISCEEVYLTVNDEKTERNIFIYGEVFNLNFSDINGFEKENEVVFPGMKIVITNSVGDTVLLEDDLYGEYRSGVNLNPIVLISDITVAAPMASNRAYTLFVEIWDKLGNSSFTAQFYFTVERDKSILVESNKVSCREIYLFVKEREKVIIGNTLVFDERTYMIFEGLSGFTEENDMVFPGLGIKITDADGLNVVTSEDLFSQYNKSGIPVSDFKDAVSSNFIIPVSQIKNPLHCEIAIWDKKSDVKIVAKTDLNIK